MAGTSSDFQHGAPFYLDPTQQDLLLAALASNDPNPNDILAMGLDSAKHGHDASQFQYPLQTFDSAYFASPQQATPATGTFSNGSIDESPLVDYLDGENHDFDRGDNSDLMIGALPGDTTGDSNEKRKSLNDDEEEEDGPERGGKRREGEDKQAKKPGRKPLTSEPTTKRKAQNRAAQRAFRDRKEKHLKDLETKVGELEKASDATNHENGLLRAQVQRLQTELREYRKRLSLSSPGLNRNSPSASGFSSLLGKSTNTYANSNFSFDFPRFGGLPGTQLLDNSLLPKTKDASITSTVPGRQYSSGGSMSSNTNNHRLSAAISPTSTSALPSKDGVQRSNTRNGVTTLNEFTSTNPTAPRSSIDNSTQSQSRIFQFNSGSSSYSGSQSVSSTSPTNQDSSCGTSPEPSHTSPKQNLDTIADGYVCHGNSEVYPATVKSTTISTSTIDDFVNQNGGQFDPTLFGEYRETQAAIVGEGDFTGGFFNDAFLNADYGSPFHFGDTPTVQKTNPIEEIVRAQDGEEEVVPGEDVNSMLNCHKIWDKLSSRPEFKDGTIDIDNLCSELRAKARCSESGVVIDHKDVEAALQRLPKENTSI